MAKQNNQQHSGCGEKPIIKEGKETPTPRPPQPTEDKSKK
jgi:hypothetical protein